MSTQSLIASSGERYQQNIPFGWYCIEHSRNLKQNEVKPLIYFGEDLVLFRTKSGEVKALDAYCPHLGAHLGYGGTVKGEAIACPFHGWEFNGNGVTTAVPYAHQQPSIVNDKPCIYAYPTIESQGLIWVWYHPQRIEPLWIIDPVEELNTDEWLEPDTFDNYDFKIKSIIQEMGENAVDTAHFVYVHGTEIIPTGEINIDGYGRSTDVDTRVPDLENPPTEGEEYGFIDGKLHTRSIGPGQTIQIFDSFFRNIMLGSVTPIDAETVHLRFTFAKPKVQTEAQNMLSQLAIDEIVRQVQQDIPIWENKKYAKTPMLCDNDGPIIKYRQWFQQFYV